MSRRRKLALPVAVLIGLGISALVYTQLNGARYDSETLNVPFLASRLESHVLISLVSFAIVVAIAVPLGVLLAGAGKAVRIPVFMLANLGQAVPGIGILVLISALLGLGAVPAVIALVAYGTLPVLRNTVAGIQGVDPAAVEAARGMGMTRRQALLRVQLPLASPLIFAGLRTALVLVISTATLGNFIGAQGLGDVIASGINISDRRVWFGVN